MERDAGAISMTVYSKHFNSHAHVERDFAETQTKYPDTISTHTLTWSVTTTKPPMECGSIHFNSHAHVERDLLFNFFVLIFIDFNSHAHVERDANSASTFEQKDTFQLTRSRGA